MFEPEAAIASISARPIKTSKRAMVYILGISMFGVFLLFTAGWLPWSDYFLERDPYKNTIEVECAKGKKLRDPFEFPPPNPNPQIDMRADYPSPPPGVYYPPLIGDPTVIVQFDYEIGNWIGSPSLVKLEDGTWIASMDVKVVSNDHSAAGWETQIFTSKDDGATWTKTARIKNLTWGSLFKIGEDVYILGAGDLNTKIRISRMYSVDDWSPTAVIVDSFHTIHTGNVGVLVTLDKVQTCIKNGRDQDVYVLYAFIEQDDLMKPWRISNTARDKMRDYKHSIRDLFNIEYLLSEEGVMVPYGRKYAQIILRVNNEELFGLSERYIWNLETNHLHFLKLSVDPGWGSAHGFVIYDQVSKFYWMVSNYGRDTNRDVYDLPLYIPKAKTCSVDRSILGLYYNKHLTDSWHLAGFVSYSSDFAHHASYPFLVQDGDDLVFVARAHLGGPYNETTVNHGKQVCTAFAVDTVTANNHNSNMAIFSRITNFRQYIHPMMWYGRRKDNPWAQY